MKLKEALGSYGDYIKFKMTFPAWLAVILAIVLCVLNANREKLERSFKGETLSGANAVSGTNQGILPITNYYPWEELQLCTLHMTGHAMRNIWMDYKYVGCAGEVDRKSAQIVADIVFKTTKGVFIIPGISWFISQIQRQGETERKSFQAVPFSAQDVINVECMLRTVEVLADFLADSSRLTVNGFSLLITCIDHLSDIHHQLFGHTLLCRELVTDLLDLIEILCSGT